MAQKKLNTKGTLKQDLTAARAELKQFRHDVALLKRKGLLDKKYDARSAVPTKYLKSQIKKLGDVLTGKAQSVKVSPAKARYYKSKDYVVKNNRVIVNVRENEKVYAAPSRGDFITKTFSKSGTITKYDKNIDVSNIQQFERDLIDGKIKLKPGEQISFQYYGNNSYRSFMSMRKLVEYLHSYPAYQQAWENQNPAASREIIKNVVIIKITPNPDYIHPLTLKPEPKMTPTPHTNEERRQIKSERERERRRLMKIDSDPAVLEKYKSAAKKRAKKSYEKNYKK